MRIDLSNLDATVVLAAACVALCIFVPFGIALDKPTKEESYNNTLRHCATYSSINERNYCRTQITEYYKDKEEQ